VSVPLSLHVFPFPPSSSSSSFFFLSPRASLQTNVAATHETYRPPFVGPPRSAAPIVALFSLALSLSRHSCSAVSDTVGFRNERAIRIAWLAFFSLCARVCAFINGRRRKSQSAALMTPFFRAAGSRGDIIDKSNARIRVARESPRIEDGANLRSRRAETAQRNERRSSDDHARRAIKRRHRASRKASAISSR